LGNSVSIKSCRNNCVVYEHCGGWNDRYREELNIAINPIKELPHEYQEIGNNIGGIFDLNPANH
jgi:hypothetical protein